MDTLMTVIRATLYTCLALMYAYDSFTGYTVLLLYQQKFGHQCNLIFVFAHSSVNKLLAVMSLESHYTICGNVFKHF